MAGLRLLIAVSLLFVMLLPGCSTRWRTASEPEPVTYIQPDDALSRTTGKLRRLLLLPAVLTSEDCPDSPSDQLMAEKLYQGTFRYLRDWKGYDLVFTDEKELSKLIEAVDYLGNWQEGEVGDGVQPPNSHMVLIQESAKQLNVDGYIVIHGRLRCLNAMDIALYFMIVGIPNWTKKMAGENLSAGIYEINNGTLVWKQQISAMHPGVNGGGNPDDWAEYLFNGLEQAIPKVLLD